MAFGGTWVLLTHLQTNAFIVGIHHQLLALQLRCAQLCRFSHRFGRQLCEAQPSYVDPVGSFFTEDKLVAVQQAPCLLSTKVSTTASDSSIYPADNMWPIPVPLEARFDPTLWYIEVAVSACPKAGPVQLQSMVYPMLLNDHAGPRKAVLQSSTDNFQSSEPSSAARVHVQRSP